jgi:hypothetical protein
LPLVKSFWGYIASRPCQDNLYTWSLKLVQIGLATGFENGVREITSAHLAVSCLRALKAMVLSFAYWLTIWAFIRNLGLAGWRASATSLVLQGTVPCSARTKSR